MTLRVKESGIPRGFDWKTYIRCNPDLKMAGVDTRKKAVHHWLHHGQYEDRFFPTRDPFPRRAWNVLLRGRNYSPFRSHPYRIIIDITNFCHLNCVDCNRSCGQGQAMANEHVTPDQIRRFVTESLDQERLWEKIRIEGGEPTAHPQLFDILGILLEYTRRHSPSATIMLCTNGYGERARQVLARMPPGIVIVDSAKQSRSSDSHCAFNMAPVDHEAYEDGDFSNGCWLPTHYGIGLTRYGYYPHPICGNIDRVFGFDIGRKSLPAGHHLWMEQYRKLCPYCGHYNGYAPSGVIRNPEHIQERGKMSPAWQEAYRAYKLKKPLLSLY